jgi:hypothetical protein
MPAWIRALLATPPQPMTPLARYTFWNGVGYMAVGFFVYLMPGATEMAGGPALAGGEVGMTRIAGLCVMIIGWFYCMGARTNADSFGLATVADRIAVPFLLAPLVLFWDVELMTIAAFAIVDPTLALGAYLIWRKQSLQETS